MRQEEKLAIELCKPHEDCETITSLISKPNFDWNRFLSIVYHHMVATITLDKLSQYPLPPSHSKQIKSYAIDALIKTHHNHRTFFNELNRINGLFKKHGIDFILMKGLSIDTEKKRTIGDIDILIRKDKTIRAIDVLKELDYQYIGNTRNPYLTRAEREQIELQLSWNNQYEMFHSPTGILVELHTNLFERQRVYYEDISTLLDNIDLFWDNKQYNERLGCSIFSPELSLILVCIHNAIRRSPANNRFTLRSIVDIHSLVQGGIEWDAVIFLSQKLKVGPFVYFSLFVSKLLLEVNIPSNSMDILYEDMTKSQRILTKIHLKCIRNLESSSILHSKIYKLLTPFIFSSNWIDRIKWLSLTPILFPPKWKMASYFGLPRNSPLLPLTYLLNPLRWLVIFLKKTTRNIHII